jgi:hypothetical protein
MNSWFSFSEQIRFYLQSKNAHGIHSPFVYNFYTSVKSFSKKQSNFFSEPTVFSQKQNQIIQSILAYLDPNKILLIQDENRKEMYFQKFFSKKTTVFIASELQKLPQNKENFDLIVLSNSLLSSHKELFRVLSSYISSNSVVIIPHIHASKLTIDQWKTLIEENPIQLSLDLYFIGLLFFRTESSKQNFHLRF